jgi:hypothetical protein
LTLARTVVVLVTLAVVAGCGGDDETSTTRVSVYWLRDGKVWPTAREVEGPLVESEALRELFEGPTPS